jgi:hypothetical protein
LRAFGFPALDCASSVGLVGALADGAVADVAVAGVLVAAGVAAALTAVAGVGVAVASGVLAPLLVGGVPLVVEPVPDVLDVLDDDVLDASGFCACLAAPAAPRAVFAALEPSELVRSRPGVMWLAPPLP